ncbi:MAG: DHH family phosphoesterase [Chloroflexi bacterium]|nr:DHH family phosphoesterase [Chloroflexota bacterium]
MDKSIVERVRRTLHEAGHVLLLTHERPDGDAMGSLLGMAWMLQAAGRRVSAVSRDGVPGSFRFLPGSEMVSDKLPAAADMCLLLDCSDAHRIGDFPTRLPCPATVNIDHHVTNTHFAEANLVDAEASATAEVVCELAESLDLPLTSQAATCLLTGVVSDTLGFRTSNVSLRTVANTRRLMEAGANLPAIVEASLYRRSFAATRYWAAGLARLQRDGTLVWTALRLADRAAAGYPGRDDADLINVLSTIEGTAVAVVFVEQDPQRTKVSWRARNGADISALAAGFGGGGHPAAAGATVPGALEEVQARVIAATREWLRGHTPTPPSGG